MSCLLLFFSHAHVKKVRRLDRFASLVSFVLTTYVRVGWLVNGPLLLSWRRIHMGKEHLAGLELQSCSGPGEDHGSS